MRINLRVARYEDLEALERGHPAVTHRLYTNLRLHLRSKWSDPLRAIVDTGAPYSVIPRDLGTQLVATSLYRTRMGGLVPKEYMYGTMVETECMATDEENSSEPFKIRAIVADKIGIPLLLGLHGILDQEELITRISSREAWLQLH